MSALRNPRGPVGERGTIQRRPDRRCSMPICRICLQVRPTLKFETGRIAICGYCVHSLNSTTLTPRAAFASCREQLRAALHHKHPDASSWDERWLSNNFERILSDRLRDPGRVGRSPELKVLRAHRRQLVCFDRRYLNYPANWDFKRYRLKYLHGSVCFLCPARESDGHVLHAHHIVHLSNSGTNSYANLVTVCHRCHERLHPGLVLGADYGERPGTDPDDAIELEPAGSDATEETDWTGTNAEELPQTDSALLGGSGAENPPPEPAPEPPAPESENSQTPEPLATVAPPQVLTPPQSSPSPAGDSSRFWGAVGQVLLTIVLIAILVGQCSR